MGFSLEGSLLSSLGFSSFEGFLGKSFSELKLGSLLTTLL